MKTISFNFTYGFIRRIVSITFVVTRYFSIKIIFLSGILFTGFQLLIIVKFPTPLLCINFSISAISLGTPLLIFSNPLSVTTMSSSMRTPMFIYFSIRSLILAISLSEYPFSCIFSKMSGCGSIDLMCKNEYRRLKVRSRILNEKDLDFFPHPGENNLLEKNLIESEFKEFLFKELTKLNQLKQNTFLLRFQENFSIKEISEILECSEGTVKSRLFYTTKYLAKKLKAFNPKISR